MTEYIDPEFFTGDTLTVARNLLGTKLTFRDCEGIIVETEAYKDDPASHAVTKPQKGLMLKETYGHIYVFFVYGMYYCLNFTTEKHGTGAVLIRAIEPTAGLGHMKKRRCTDKIHNLTNGPGKLFQAFGLDPKLHGEIVGRSVKLMPNRNVSESEIVTGPRIGVSKAADLPWRFSIKDNPFVSHSKHRTSTTSR
ncbi:DNA-3-methyladenine glycosylase [candidate division KSB1 bacterium]|nr:DNA-3-methyladenine glycosylase [candidate division KSB1 bacterium]NIR71960.1 DNA-3-methyladenine glycosylase [candidate division KSB1 bacterium]NIS24958.1 DNA-3-methyladenine glycosylase [candidate division KSB1 bacterium]NIT71878.1 DNA-3-methyladenine glycosylase [candidate division KSB1 bacterium]NIU25609.1 DNA-3-methyladenine glycosylase [candidate division KSB1 bacterium]